MMKRGIFFTPWASTLAICLYLLLSPLSGSARAVPPGGVELMVYVNEAPGTWYTGKIDFIDDARISIADVSHGLSGDVIFVSRHGDRVSRRYFPVGKKVKMLLNAKYRCLILLEI